MCLVEKKNMESIREMLVLDSLSSEKAMTTDFIAPSRMNKIYICLEEDKYDRYGFTNTSQVSCGRGTSRVPLLCLPALPILLSDIDPRYCHLCSGNGAAIT